MRKRSKWILTSAALVLVAGGAAAFALRGPQQVLWPKLNNLHEIAPGVYTDDVTQSATRLTTLAEARGILGSFYPVAKASPWIVLCTTDACSKLFFGERKPRGMTWGEHLVVITPDGLNPMILSHELAHAELHRLFTLSDLRRARFPAWFNEGLSTWISKDDRLVAPDDAARARIRQAWGVQEWGLATKEMGWPNSYGAAQGIVTDMIEAQGEVVMHALIDRVAEGEAFELVLAELFP